MIDSLTIFSKTGTVLYHYSLEQASTTNANVISRNEKDNDNGKGSHRRMSPSSTEAINTFLCHILLDHNRYSKLRNVKRAILPSSSSSSSSSLTTMVEWEESPSRDWMALVLYPQVLVSSSSSPSSLSWIRHLLRSVLREYALFYDSLVASSNSDAVLGDGGDKKVADDDDDQIYKPAPDGTLFDATYKALYRRSEVMGRRPGGVAAGDEEDHVESLSSEDEWDGGKEEEEKENDKSETDPSNEMQMQERVVGNAVQRARKLRQQQQHSTTKIKKKGKEARVWHDTEGKVTKEKMAALDRSKDSNPNLSSIDAAVADDSRALAEARAAYLPSSNEIPMWELDETLDDSVDTEDGDSSDRNDNDNSRGWGSSLKNLFDQVSGNKVLTPSDLDAPLKDMQKLLTSKNVANDIAEEICENVKSKLVGKRMASFSRVKTAVRQALESAIEKILKPTHKRNIDLMQAVVTKRQNSAFNLFGASKKKSKPYVIVMVGINGVGKSTSLAKIAYYLKSNKCNPILAACDTFRSGAVEQLNVHAKCLGVPLYQKGYAKDPAAVATAAIEHASQEGHDVVLVDTAGRMQNNVPLMKALSKLVVENDPDLVLFVCEALVGNDGIDQLNMFNKALRSGGHSRQIDGIVLTKFDTVSDKVGAALTMTHITGAPVVFVGTGQKYNHLKKLSVQSVIKSLFA